MTERTTAQTAAALIALGFLVVGVAGFVPGVTTDYTGFDTTGRSADAELFDVFRTSVLHNAIHLAFGVAGLVLARSPVGAWVFLVGGGILYLDLAIYGFAIDLGSRANFVPLDTADNVLHLVLGATMVALGLLTARRGAPQPAAA